MHLSPSIGSVIGQFIGFPVPVLLVVEVPPMPVPVVVVVMLEPVVDMLEPVVVTPLVDMLDDVLVVLDVFEDELIEVPLEVEAPPVEPLEVEFVVEESTELPQATPITTTPVSAKKYVAFISSPPALRAS